MVPTDDPFKSDVRSADDVRAIFRQLRKEVTEAEDRGDLTLLYRRAGFVVTKVENNGSQKESADVLRQVIDEEFANTARRINRRARELECTPDYEEAWVDDPLIAVGESSEDPLSRWRSSSDETSAGWKPS